MFWLNTRGAFQLQLANKSRFQFYRLPANVLFFCLGLYQEAGAGFQLLNVRACDLFRQHFSLYLSCSPYDLSSLGTHVNKTLGSTSTALKELVVRPRLGPHHVRRSVRILCSYISFMSCADWPCSAFHQKIASLRPGDLETRPDTFWVGVLKHNKKPTDDLLQTDCLWAKCSKVCSQYSIEDGS